MLNSNSKTIILDTLQSYWGYNSLRSIQEGPVESLTSGSDTLAILPTGGGKSLCYQLPALCRGGMCLVISPLISLMEDQCNQLKRLGVKAEALTSSLGAMGIDRVLENASIGKVDFLYMSPERIEDQTFKARYQKFNITTIVVDEAHCISQWGHDFRPEFRKINTLRNHFPEAVWGAFTATATTQVVDDICEQLKLKDFNVFKASMRRPNLIYHVNNWGDPNVEIIQQALKLFSVSPNDTGLLYVQNRALADKFAQRLLSLGINATSFHAGLSSNEKSRRQKDWIKGKIPVMACTSAFGMGINKADVRWVLHYNMPSNLESFVQEAGRAGRDSHDSVCISFVSDALRSKSLNDLSSQFPSLEEIRSVYQNLANQGTVAIGDLPKNTTEFNIDKSQKSTGLSRRRLRACLGILERNNHIDLVEKKSGDGSVVWLGGKNRILNESMDLHTELSRHFMRTSTSVNKVIPLKIKQLSEKFSSNIESITVALSTLDAMGLIDWMPNNTNLKVNWLSSRVDAKRLNVDFDSLARRKNLLTEKLDSVNEFIDTTECRATVLEGYFSDNSEKCGKCDNCTWDPDGKREMLLQSIENSGKTGVDAFDLIRSFPTGHRGRISIFLREMLNSNDIYVEGTKVFSSSLA